MKKKHDFRHAQAAIVCGKYYFLNCITSLEWNPVQKGKQLFSIYVSFFLKKIMNGNLLGRKDVV